MSLSIDDALQCAATYIKDPKVLQSLARDLTKAEEEIKQDKKSETGPKAKNRFVIAVRGDPSVLTPLLAGGAWVLQVRDNDPATASTLFDRIVAAVKTSNDSLKRNRASRVIRTFANAMRNLKPKAIKQATPEAPWAIKSKDPVECIVVEKEEV